MGPQWEPGQRPGAREAWEMVLCAIGAEMDRQARQLSAEAAARMEEKAPEAFSEPTSREQVRANVEGAIRAVADSLSAGTDPAAIPLPAGANAGARSRAQRGSPLPLLMRAIRVAHETLWDWVMGAIIDAVEEGELRRHAHELASAWLFTAIDSIATQYAEVYEAERERWLRSASAVRTETIEAILAGEENDAGRASTRIGYELDRHHIGLITWVDEARQAGGQAQLRSAIEELAGRAGADGTLIEPLGMLATMAWMSRAQPFEPLRLERLESRVRQAGNAAVATGEPASGLGGFRRTQSEATHARRVARLLGRAPGSVTRYRTVEATAVATVDLDLTRAFVARTLAALTAEDDGTRRVAATLSVYLQEGCSRSRAARRLGIHENTVGYRVRQAEGILGHPVASDQLMLSLALLLLPAVRARSASSANAAVALSK